MVRRFVPAFVLLCALSAAGCGDSSPSSPLVPTTGTTLTFSGTLTFGSTSTHVFDVPAAGTVYVTTSSFSPQDVRIGLGFGNWIETSFDTTVTDDEGNTTTVTETQMVCSLVLQSTNARQGQVFTGAVKAGSTYCIALYDTGRLLTDLVYTVEVNHP